MRGQGTVKVHIALMIDPGTTSEGPTWRKLLLAKPVLPVAGSTSAHARTS